MTQTICLCLLFATATAMAEEPQDLRDPGQKTLRVVRATTPPTIDGVLDEAEWAGAARIDDLYQVSPQEYAEPSERTEVYVFYDDDAFLSRARRAKDRCFLL